MVKHTAARSRIVWSLVDEQLIRSSSSEWQCIVGDDEEASGVAERHLHIKRSDTRQHLHTHRFIGDTVGIE